MTNKSTKRRNAVIAAVAGAALLVGGSTYALWQASVPLQGGSITSGNLALEAGDSTQWDVSVDRLDQKAKITTAETAPQGVTPISTITLDELGHAIEDLENWTMVPGDTVALTFPYRITLEGDNLVAQLGIDIDPTSQLWANLDAKFKDPNDEQNFLSYITVNYKLLRADGSLVNQGAISEASTLMSYFQAANQLDGSLEDPTLDEANQAIPVIDGTEEFVLILYVNFNYETPNVDMVNTTLVDLTDGMKATLQQVRCNPPELGGNFTC